MLTRDLFAVADLVVSAMPLFVLDFYRASACNACRAGYRFTNSVRLTGHLYQKLLKSVDFSRNIPK